MHVASLIDSSTCVSCMFLCYMYVCVYIYMYSFIACYEMYMYEECKYSVLELVLTNKFISRAARKYDVARLCQNVIKRHGFRK